VLEKVTVRRVFLRVLAVQRCLMLVFTYILFIPEGQYGQAWNFQKAVLCRMSEIIGYRSDFNLAC